ncbi:MAG TPA: tetratricopeptide repeat protein, partial [Aggregatilineales bacterium]|nr:tetratricopeptide repeat protein [Aggregatilineales bacterium]
QLEPTWDVGWINLAHLYEQTGQYDKALNSLFTARAINPLSDVINFNIGRMGENYDLLDAEAIVAHYYLALYHLNGGNHATKSDFWSQTDLRIEALRQYIANREKVYPVTAYRLITHYFPDELADFIPQNPQSASDWWM